MRKVVSLLGKDKNNSNQEAQVNRFAVCRVCISKVSDRVIQGLISSHSFRLAFWLSGQIQ